MPDKLPVLKTETILRILFKLGFTPKRKRGSHLILGKKEEIVVIPIHAGRDIPKGTLHNILKQAKISVNDLKKYL